MSAAEVYGQEDLEQPVAKPWTPRVITGGKGPPDFPGPPTENWLTKLPIGTTFTAQPRSSMAEKNLYSIVFHSDSEETTLLMWRLPDGKMLDMYFNPEAFCRLHFKPDILGTLAPEKQEETDGTQRNRTDQSPSLVLHEAVSGEHQVLPEEE